MGNECIMPNHQSTTSFLTATVLVRAAFAILHAATVGGCNRPSPAPPPTLANVTELREHIGVIVNNSTYEMHVFVNAKCVAKLQSHCRFSVTEPTTENSQPQLASDLAIVIMRDNEPFVVARGRVRGLLATGKLILTWPSSVPIIDAAPVESARVDESSTNELALVEGTLLSSLNSQAAESKPFVYDLATLSKRDTASRTDVVMNMLGDSLVKVEAGQQWIGESAPGYQVPKRFVKLTRSFWIARTEVSLAQFNAVMLKDPASHTDGTLPVTGITWDDAVEYCDRLSALTGMKFRLPTDAEWEVACRAGTDTPWHFGTDVSLLDKYAWTSLNSDGRLHPVGTKIPNGLGLYDMYGNAREWCSDWAIEPTSSNMLVDPVGPTEDEARRYAVRVNEDSPSKVARGGCFTSPPVFIYSASIFAHPPESRESYVGFRVVMDDLSKR